MQSGYKVKGQQSSFPGVNGNSDSKIAHARQAGDTHTGRSRCTKTDREANSNRQIKKFEFSIFLVSCYAYYELLQESLQIFSPFTTWLERIQYDY